jgi:hypothetical protein
MKSGRKKEKKKKNPRMEPCECLLTMWETSSLGSMVYIQMESYAFWVFCKRVQTLVIVHTNLLPTLEPKV